MRAEHDLFLSYRWIDRAAVEPLLEALAQRGITTWQDVREVDDFASIQSAINNGLGSARALLAWYSLRYNESRACQWELTTAYLAGQAEGDPRKRILVVNPERINSHIYLPELFDQLHLSGANMVEDPAVVYELAERVQAALDHNVPADPIGRQRSHVSPPWLPNHRTGSTRFVGRLREMWQLHSVLQAGHAAVLTGGAGNPAVVQLRGAGGAGKTLMAEEYALRFGSAFPGGIFWLRGYGYIDHERVIGPAERDAMRESQLNLLAACLGLHVQGLAPPEVLGKIARHLGHAGQPFLWIVDDLPLQLGGDGMDPWLAPHPLGHTLITTRSRRFNHVSAVEVPQLDETEALRLLARVKPIPTTDEPAADEICRELGYHALAIDVAAVLVQRRGYTDFLTSLRREDRDALEFASTVSSEALPSDHNRSIAATFLASIRELDAPTIDLLRLASVLAAARIPRELIWRTLARADALDDYEAQSRCDRGIDRLLTSNLADDREGGAISVHTLVSRTQRFCDTHVPRRTILRAAAIRTFNYVLPRVADIREHAQLADWIAHARELGRTPTDAEEAILTGWVARHDSEQGQYRLAADGYSAQLDTRRRVLGDEHPDTLISIGNLASMLGSTGDLVGARELQEQALETTRRVMGEHHWDTLRSMNNLALTLENQGDWPAARTLQERVLRATRLLRGAEHPDTLTAMNNLALTMVSQGDWPGARALQELSLEAMRRVLGDEHPDTLTATNNLSSTLWIQGDLTAARALQEQALETMRRVLGGEHPDTLMVMRNLANTLRSQGDLPGARSLQDQELKTTRLVMGDEHPHTLTSMSNVASTLWSQGDLTAARALQEQALETMRRVLGGEHPTTLSSMGNLACILMSQGDLPGAQALQEQAVETTLRLLGTEHPNTLLAMSNLANTLRSEGNLTGARLLQEQVLAGRRRVLGEEHPDTLVAISNLAHTLGGQGNLSLAREMQEQVLPTLRRVLGNEHPCTLTATNNLAITRRSQGDLGGARTLQEEVLSLSRKVLGEEHPDTLTSMNDLAWTAWSQADRIVAVNLQSNATSGRQRILGNSHPDTLAAMNALDRMMATPAG